MQINQWSPLSFSRFTTKDSEIFLYKYEGFLQAVKVTSGIASPLWITGNVAGNSLGDDFFQLCGNRLDICPRLRGGARSQIPEDKATPQAIAEWLTQNQITELEIGSKSLDPHRLDAVIKALNLCRPTSIQKLYASKAELGDKGLTQLSSSLCAMPDLQELWLMNNNIGEEGLKALCDQLPLTNIKKLVLGYNPLGNACKWLGTSLPKSKVEELNLTATKIGDAELRGFAANHSLANITTLVVSNNSIQSVEYLIQLLLDSGRISTLWIQKNSIDEKGIEAIANNLPKSSVTYLEYDRERAAKNVNELIEEALKGNKNKALAEAQTTENIENFPEETVAKEEIIIIEQLLPEFINNFWMYTSAPIPDHLKFNLDETEFLFFSPVMDMDTGDTVERELYLKTNPAGATAILKMPSLKGIVNQVQNFCNTYPGMEYEMYMPQSHLEECREALSEVDQEKMQAILEKDSRLLHPKYHEGRPLFEIALETKNLGLFKAVAAAAKDRLPICQNTCSTVAKWLGKEGLAYICQLHPEPFPFAQSLSFAIQNTNAAYVQALIELEPSLINRKSEEGNTPLHLAIHAGNVEIIDLLLEAGADIKLMDTARRTPVQLAEHLKRDDLVERISIKKLGQKIDPLMQSSIQPIQDRLQRHNKIFGLILRTFEIISEEMSNNPSSTAGRQVKLLTNQLTELLEKD